MSTIKVIEPWKVAAIKGWHQQRLQHPEGNINWTEIVRQVEAVDRKTFVGCASASRKLSDFIKRNPTLVEEVLKELEDPCSSINMYPGVSKKNAKKKAGKATSAHVNDEDKDEESEEEVVPCTNINGFKTNKDGSIGVEAEISDFIDSKELMNEDVLLKKLGYDPLVWEVVSSSCRKGQWEAQVKDGDVKTLYSYRVNANVKKREGSVCESALLDAMIKHVNSKKTPKYVPVVVDGENIAILSIADLHLGKLAWHKECGANYDYKICRERYFYIINSAITYLKGVHNLEKVIFFWSQDFFHYDSLRIETTAGTPQDTDVRWQKLYQEGCKMLVDGIELLKNELNIPIQTFYTRSNHDTQVSFYALQYLYAWFNQDEDVVIDTNPIGRKYVEYGVNLMGFGHGDEEKKRIHLLMQNEQREAWGRTVSHEFFLGHFHKQMVNDEGGVVARYLASPTESDAWHYNSGYLGAMKQAQVFIRNKYEGPTDEHTINICE